MSIYYFGEFIGIHTTQQKQTSSSPTLVGDILKNRNDYQTLSKPKTTFTVRHFQEC
jgi:hypothetical protein